jgi:hypothetical protein
MKGMFERQFPVSASAEWGLRFRFNDAAAGIVALGAARK